MKARTLLLLLVPFVLGGCFMYSDSKNSRDSSARASAEASNSAREASESASRSSSGKTSSSSSSSSSGKSSSSSSSSSSDEFTADGFLVQGNTIKSAPDYVHTGVLRIPSTLRGRSITGIAEYGFANNSYITEVYVPDSIVSIGKGAFSNDTAITKMTLPFCGNSRNAEGTSGNFGAIFGNFSATGLVKTYSFYSTAGSTQTYYIPASITELTFTDASSFGIGALSGLTKVTTINLPNKKFTLGDYCFANSTALERLELPNVAKIPDYCFFGCIGLSEFHFGGAASIGQYAFRNCQNLVYLNSDTSRHYVIPESVTSIGNSAFEGCSLIRKITLPFIGESASANDDVALFGYIFGKNSYSSSTRVKQYYASGTSSYANFYIPSSLYAVEITGATKVGYGAFMNMSMLTSLNINEGAQRNVGEKAFENCIVPTWTGSGGSSSSSSSSSSFSSSQSSSSASSSSSSSSSGSSSASSASSSSSSGSSSSSSSVDPLLNVYAMVDNQKVVVSNLKDTSTDYSGMKAVYQLELTKGQKAYFSNGSYSYNFYSYDDENAGYVYLGSEYEAPITDVYTFYLDSSNRMTIGSSTVYTGPKFLYSDSKITAASTLLSGKIEIPSTFKGNAVTTIPTDAFKNCKNITEVSIPSSVTYIGKGAFSGCSAIKTVTVPFMGITPDGADANGHFGNLFGNVSYSDSYKATQWIATGSSSYYIPTALKTINILDGSNFVMGALCNLSSVTAINFTIYPTAIPKHGFSYDTSLVSMEFPATTKTVADFAFYDCYSLTTLYLPGVTSIGASAFEACSALSHFNANGDGSFRVPDTVTYLGLRCFGDCSKMKALITPFVGCADDAIERYGLMGSLFSDLSGPEKTAVRQRTGVGSAVAVYYVPSSLMSIQVTKATRIHDYSFMNFSQLLAVYINKGASSNIGTDAFLNCVEPIIVGS